MENNSVTRNSRRSDILTLLTLLSVDVKLAVLEGSVINQLEVGNFSLLHFSKWPCLVHVSDMSLTCEKVGHM